jgi:hypothetical protein
VTQLPGTLHQEAREHIPCVLRVVRQHPRLRFWSRRSDIPWQDGMPFPLLETAMEVSLRLLPYPLLQLLHTKGDSYHSHGALLPSTECQPAGSLCNVQGSPPSTLPCSRRGPSALPEVLHSYGPSGHPLAFNAVTNAYLPPRSFSSGPGGLRQFQYNPSVRAAVITPPGPCAGFSQAFRHRCCLRQYTRSSAPGSLYITRLAQRSLPAARTVAPQTLSGFVRRLRPRLSAKKRLLSFMTLAFAMLGLPPNGLYCLIWSRRIHIRIQYAPVALEPSDLRREFVAFYG